VTYRGRFAIATVAFLLALAGAATFGGAAVAKKARSKATATVVTPVNQPIPDGVTGAAPGILRSTATVGKKLKGLAISDVNLIFQTTGAAADSASDIRVRLTAPDGTTVSPILGAFGQSIGPLTLDDETPVRTCPDATPPCVDPDRSLGVPFAGKATPQTMFDLDGGPAAGTWSLRVADVGTGDTSVLNSWSLEVVAERPAGKPGKPVTVSKNVNLVVPDATGTTQDGVLRQTIAFGKKFKGRSIGDVDVTVQTTGSSADAAEDIRMRLVSPAGNKSQMVPTFAATGLPGQSVGPLTYDDDTPIQPCLDDTPPCGDPDTLPQPFSGVASPRTPLSQLDGGPVRGNWTLVLQDSLAGDTTTLNSWSLRVLPRGSPRRGAKKATAAKRKGGVPKVIKAASTASQPIPDSNPGVQLGLLRSTLDLGKKYRGLRIADVNATVQSSGSPPNAGIDLSFRLTAPNGATSYLANELEAQSVGPLTLDDEVPATICNTSSPPCDNPDASLFTPFAGSTAPDVPLKIMDGGPVRGKWTLTVVDSFGGNTNSLTSWRLAIVPRRPAK
jgi:subtilisin-like proprotein convertase family protein